MFLILSNQKRGYSLIVQTHQLVVNSVYDLVIITVHLHLILVLDNVVYKVNHAPAIALTVLMIFLTLLYSTNFVQMILMFVLIHKQSRQVARLLNTFLSQAYLLEGKRVLTLLKHPHMQIRIMLSLFVLIF